MVHCDSQPNEQQRQEEEDHFHCENVEMSTAAWSVNGLTCMAVRIAPFSKRSARAATEMESPAQTARKRLPRRPANTARPRNVSQYSRMSTKSRSVLRTTIWMLWATPLLSSDWTACLREAASEPSSMRRIRSDSCPWKLVAAHMMMAHVDNARIRMAAAFSIARMVFSPNYGADDFDCGRSGALCCTMRISVCPERGNGTRPVMQSTMIP